MRLCEMQVWNSHDHDTFMTWQDVLHFADDYFVRSSIKFLQYAHEEITSCMFFSEDGKLYAVADGLFSNSHVFPISDSVGNLYFGNFAMRPKVIFSEVGTYVAYEKYNKVVYRSLDGIRWNLLVPIAFYPTDYSHFVAKNIVGKAHHVEDVSFLVEV